MTPQEYEKFAEALQENGYKKYGGCLSNEDFYWCKGMEYKEDEDGDKRSSYQVLYLIWDMRKYKDIPGNSHFGVQMRVLISENRRTDLVRCHENGDNIKKNEIIAQSFYEWAKKNLEKLVEPKFKVGNKIEKCGYRFTIAEVKDDYYLTKCGNKIPFENQDDFSLVPNKFDITTLKTFESRVLVRDYNNRIWIPTFWGKRLEDDSNCIYLTTNGCYKYCIPYEGNEHLLGTTNDCDDFYKTWEK